MEETIQFKKATSADLELLVELRLRFALELNGKQPEEDVRRLHDSLYTYFEKSMIEKSCCSIIARLEGQTAGIGTIVFRETPGGFKNPSGKWGYIMNMYTLPEFRKRGICSGILNLLVNEGKQRSVGAFELHATEEGLPVYLKSGFNIHSEPTLRKFLNP